MTTLKRIALVLIFTCAGALTATRAQTPSVEVSTEGEAVEFSARGAARGLHVEVYTPSGELVFEADDSGGQPIRWAMADRKGERVPDGVYLAAITAVDSLGKKRKSIEQVTVGGQASAAGATVAEASPPQESLAPTGAGTVGKLAKWTTSTNLGNSVITEGAGGKVGVNVAPTATLQANGLQPAARATTGAPAPTLLQTSGGKGGNTTGATGQVAGAGAGIALYAGQGGDAPAGGKRGNGGSIVLQAGPKGGGAGTAGADGSVLINPMGVGNVAIGAGTATSRLTVNGMIQTTGAGGIKFPDNSVQTKAANISGAGTPGQLVKFTGPNSFGNSSIVENVDGRVGIGLTNPMFGSLHVSGGSRSGIFATSDSGNGVHGESGSATASGIYGHNSGGGEAGHFEGNVGITKNLSFGATTRQMVNLYGAAYGIGVQYGTQYFRSDLHFGWYRGGAHSNAELNPGGGVRVMYLDAGGNLFTSGAMTPSSDRNMKANITPINPRTVLAKVAALPIQTWNYKAESEDVRHIGPMAQDFRAAFGLGTDDKTIATVDADGVALASIQALYQLMLEKDRKIERLQARVTRLEQAGRRGRHGRARPRR